MKTLSETLLNLGHDHPDSIAVRLLYDTKPDNELTYSALIRGSINFSRAYNQAGINPGEVVILILQHGEDLLYAFLGAILHGSIPAIMPFLTEKLSVEQYRQSLIALFQVTAPAAVVTYPQFLAEVDQAARHSKSVRVILNCMDIKQHTEFSQNPYTFNSQPSLEDIVLLQHSSGSTGLQKGVALTHQAVMNQLQSYSRAIQLCASDVIVSWLPLYHDMGLIAGFLLPILSGVPLVLLSPFDWVRAPYRLLQSVSQYKGTLSWLPNFAYNFCAQKIRTRELDGIDLSTWRAVINCSEPMYLQSHHMFLERFQPYGLRSSSLATCYAMAENVFAVSQGGIDRPVTVDQISQRRLLLDRLAIPSDDQEDSLEMLSTGKPIEHTHVKIVDQHQDDLDERKVGEIAIRSDCMLMGYYNRPELSKIAFADGWYLTGDLGYIAGGEIYITGRKKDLIIVGGKNIYPQDLENLASEVKGVHPGRVCAFGIYNQAAGTEDVVIIAEVDRISPKYGDEAYPSSSDEDRIADEIRLRVTRGSDIALRYVKLVERGWLTKTSSGKIARSANRERYQLEIKAAV